MKRFLLALSLLAIFSHSAAAHYFHGEAHLHYSFDVAADTVFQLLQTQLTNYKYFVDSSKSVLGYSIIKALLFPEDDQNKRVVATFFKIYYSPGNKTDLIVYKSIKNGEKYWAWGIHNPFALFEFRTIWTFEPIDTPFSKAHLSKVEEIIVALTHNARL